MARAYKNVPRIACRALPFMNIDIFFDLWLAHTGIGCLWLPRAFFVTCVTVCVCVCV